VKYNIKSGAIYSVGFFLIFIGLIGLFLPILQGILFIALGLYVLSFRSEKARILLEKTLYKFPFIIKSKIRFVNWFKNLKSKVFF
jgi:uncharacterized protein YqgC (DUF456 family)